MRSLPIAVVLLLLLAYGLGVEHCGISLVVLGSTGDLARRYLWPAIFHQFQQTECGGLGESPSLLSPNCRLVVAGCTRKEEEVSPQEWWLKLLERVNCSTVSCEICLRKFTNVSIRYTFTGKDFKALSSQLHSAHENLSYSHSLGTYKEVGRIYYLATPPSAYRSLAQVIDSSGRPDDMGWLRVALEKPFGMDLSSARKLTNSLSVFLDSTELYLVDHYIGKEGVQNIVPFRAKNAKVLGSLWNKNHIQYVEVSVKERLDIVGRASFFDTYGIIRDIHQNHLMEMLVRAMLDVTSLDETNFLERKTEFLMKLHSPSIGNSVLGQYEGYLDHLGAEGLGDQASSTLTFAAVVLYMQDHSWSHVPLILSAGKRMDERTAYVKIEFKKQIFSSVSKENANCPVEMIFLIQDEAIGSPGVLYSPGLGNLQWGSEKRDLIQRGGCSYFFLSFECEDFCGNSYLSVIDNLLAGRRDQFVNVQSLLQSWRVWDLFLFELNHTQSPPIIKYSPGTLSELSLRLLDGRILTATGDPLATVDPCKDGSHVRVRGLDTVISHKSRLAACLYKRIVDEAWSAALTSGTYHLALPGGDSPKPFLELLSRTNELSFPWRSTHIWQTDERCVPSNHTSSNWRQLQEKLLSYVPIPYLNQHPMPVRLHCGTCNLSDRGCDLYEGQIWEYTGTGCMDHVVLGVGRDGHVASLFYATDMTQVNASKDEKVWLVERHATNKRMSLSFDMILCARAISVLVMGEGKVGIWRALAMDTENLEIDNTPVLALLRLAASRDVKVYLYIDESQVQDFQIAGD